MGGVTTKVAVKTLKLDENSKEEKVRFLQEAAIMGQFMYTNVLRLHGVVFNDTTVIIIPQYYDIIIVYIQPMIVVELMQKGDLRSLLHKLRPE